LLWYSIQPKSHSTALSVGALAQSSIFMQIQPITIPLWKWDLSLHHNHISTWQRTNPSHTNS